MIKGVVNALFPDGEHAVYECSIGDKHLLRSWIAYRGETSGGVHTFDTWTELDPAGLGGGGSIVRVRSRVDLDERLRPLRYVTQAAGAEVSVALSPSEVAVTLPDGAVTTVPRGEAAWLMESHIVGLDVLFLAVTHQTGALDTRQSRAMFMVNQLTAVPYAIGPAAPEAIPDEAAPAGARWFTSSYNECIQLDAGGAMLLNVNPTYGARTWRLDPAPPLPAWRDDAVPTRLQLASYSPPESASFALRDVAITDLIEGTLAVPSGQGPHPAVLFLGGSGSHDRHGIAGEVDLGYHEIVDGLASAGIAGLRFDVRTPEVTAEALTVTFSDIVNNAHAAWKALLEQPEIDPRRTAIVGHSEGATVALVLAARHGAAPNAMVLLAPGGRPMDEVAVRQTEAWGREQGMSEDKIAEQLKKTNEFIELVRSGKNFEAGEVPDLMLFSAKMVPWLREHLALAPADLVSEVSCPMLLMQGARDFQVQTEDTRYLFDAAVAAGVTAHMTVLEDVDHLLKPVEGESNLATYYEDRRVDAGALDQMASWLASELGIG